MTDAEDYQEDVDALLNLFKYGYGIEMENTIGYSMLPVIAWIEPYVHVNTSAVVNDLATAVQNGFCSKETAAERAKFYTIEGEWDRIVKEMKEEDKMDLVVSDTATTTASEEE